MGLTPEFWRGRRVLLTGHTGFKGAWLALWLEHLGAEVHGLALPPERANGAFSALAPWSALESRIVDLRDAQSTTAAVREIDPEVILHLAAQAIVRRGYADPSGTFATNVVGTAHLLDAARAAPSLRAVVVVTSDKVYRNGGLARAFVEGDELGGADPYSASKAAVELLVGSWRASYGVAGSWAVATARAGNVIGGGDTGEDRLLVDAWTALRADQVLFLRHPGSVRPWQFVLDPLAGYLMLAERLALAPESAPAALNFGPSPDAAVPVSAVVDRLFARWGAGEWAPAAEPGPPEAHALRLCADRARELLGWTPILDLDTALDWTVDWWRESKTGGSMRPLAIAQIEQYRARMG